MSIPLENVNVSRVFTKPLDVPIMHSRVILIDSFEFVWGLQRGQLSSYFNVPGNFLQLQPELDEAIRAGKVALIPPNHVVEALLEFQDRNLELPLTKRRIFTEVFSFKPTECRVVPLKPGVSVYALNPITRKVTALKGTRTSFPLVSCEAHPFFLLTYACWELFNPPPNIDRKLGLGDTLINCASSWHMEPPIEFYDGAYDGQFGRPIPFEYLELLPKPEHVHSSSSSTSSVVSRSLKRSKMSIPSQSDSDAVMDIAQWVPDCASKDLASDVDSPIVDVDVVPGRRPDVGKRPNPKRKRS